MDSQICRGYLFASYEAADRSFGLGERRTAEDVGPYEGYQMPCGCA